MKIIGREIMRNLGGELSYVGGAEGAVFRVRAPLQTAGAREMASAIS